MLDGASRAPVNRIPDRGRPSGANVAASTPYGIVTVLSDGSRALTSRASSSVARITRANGRYARDWKRRTACPCVRRHTRSTPLADAASASTLRCHASIGAITAGISSAGAMPASVPSVTCATSNLRPSWGRYDRNGADSRRAPTGSRIARAAPLSAKARPVDGGAIGNSCNSKPSGGGPSWSGWRSATTVTSWCRASREHRCHESRREPFSGARGDSDAQNRMRNLIASQRLGA